MKTTDSVTATVYTKDGTELYVEHALTQFDTTDKVDEKIENLKTGDVATNKNNIRDLQTTTTEHGEKITANATNIARNTADIGKKIDMVTAEAKLALKANAEDVYSKTDADARYATKNALDGKADITYVDQKFTDAGNNVDTKLRDYYNKDTVDGKIAHEETARDTAITEKSPIEIRQSMMPLSWKKRIAMQRLQSQRRRFRIRSRKKRQQEKKLILLSILDLIPQKVRLAQMKQPLVTSKQLTPHWKGKSLRTEKISQR